MTVGDLGEMSDGYHTFNELYRYRRLYNALGANLWARMRQWDVYKSRLHHDGTRPFGGGWFIVVIQTPNGQISNHYEDAHWDQFHIAERERATKWDGHTPAVAAQRLEDLLADPEFWRD
ncbi:hypothetical protein ACIBCN_18675 [Nocardia sp. NPDC051052]|uniref:WDGH domain-containing protein n=1 Tax=Nocardia sp. NPDC051052 TaxID=3364322 RepID=UPI0037B7252D